LDRFEDVEIFKGDESFVRRKIMYDKNFVQESFHLQATGQK